LGAAPGWVGPLMTTVLATGGSGWFRLIVCTPGWLMAKRIWFGQTGSGTCGLKKWLFAWVRASRNDPAPKSAVFVTQKMAGICRSSRASIRGRQRRVTTGVRGVRLNRRRSIERNMTAPCGSWVGAGADRPSTLYYWTPGERDAPVRKND